MKNLLREARITKELKTKDVAQALGIDQALISKFESGLRKPTKDQIHKLSLLLDLNYDDLLLLWLKEKIYTEIGNDTTALKAMKMVCDEIEHSFKNSEIKISKDTQKIIDETEALQRVFVKQDTHVLKSILQTAELEYIYKTNQLYGNSLTYKETVAVINDGLAIPGKSMREHLEVLNHIEAIDYIKEINKAENHLSAAHALQLHQILLRGIHPEFEGKYQNRLIETNHSLNRVSNPNDISKEMDDCFFWYQSNKDKIHPIVLAAIMYKRLVDLQPFLYENDKISKLFANSILMQNGYLLTSFDTLLPSKSVFSKTLKTTSETDTFEEIILRVALAEKEFLKRFL